MPWSEGKRSVGKTMFSTYRLSPVLSFVVDTTRKSSRKKRMKSFGFLSPLTSFSSKEIALFSCGCRCVRAWKVVKLKGLGAGP